MKAWCFIVDGLWSAMPNSIVELSKAPIMKSATALPVRVPGEARRAQERQVELEDGPDELVPPLQRVVPHVEGHRVLHLPAVIVLRVHARVGQVDRSRHRVAHASSVVSHVDVHALVPRGDLRERAAARSRGQVGKRELVDEPWREDVRVAHAELVHVAEDPLLHVVHVARPRRAVAAVGEEVGVQLIPAGEVVVAPGHVDGVIARRGGQRHDGAARRRGHVLLEQVSRHLADATRADDVAGDAGRTRAVGERRRP